MNSFPEAFLKRKAFYTYHYIYCRRRDAKCKYIPYRMFKKVFLGHIKNRHSKLMEGSFYFLVIFLSPLHPNVHIACGTGIPVQYYGKSSNQDVSDFCIIQRL